MTRQAEPTSRRAGARSRIAVAAALSVALGCATEVQKQEVQVGVHRVRLAPLEGWEHLDHGQQHLFRREEMQISMTDLGPLPRDAASGTDSLEAIAGHAIQVVVDMSRREVGRTERRTIHGVPWVVVESWDAVTHADPRRMACAPSAGSILVLNQDRGSGETAAGAFEGLLASIELPRSGPALARRGGAEGQGRDPT